MRNKIEISNVVYFIGGAADKTRESFGLVKWGPTNLMGLCRTAFDQKKGSSCETHYYGYLEKDAIAESIVQVKQAKPDVRINLVGHSRGGAVANELALNILPSLNINANIVVLLDPVKANPLDKFTIPKNNNAHLTSLYVCIFAKPLNRDPTDYVAIVGGQYGKRLQAYCDFYIEADANHGEPMDMLKTVLDEKETSAWDILLAESKKS
ncbi:MAG: pimeloyl-ACP methyl ester carboxylesterase [Glaciecola sp.]